jgi:DNA methylase/ParB-like nuclease domain
MEKKALRVAAGPDTASMVSGPRELPLRGLRPWPENPRSIRPDRLADLKKALEADREMLKARPLVALPDGTVICGNQRLLAAQELGWHTLPVITVELDRQRARLWALRDNSSYGAWNEAALAPLLAELKLEGVELALTGFADRDLDRILAGLAGPVEPDEAPLPTAEPDSQPGTIYELGPHRLACGEAADSVLLAALFADARPTLVWTDPPYGVGYVGKTAQRLTIQNDSSDALADLLSQALQAATPLLAAGAAFYVCCPAGPQGTTFRGSLAEAGWIHRQTLVWVKNAMVLGHGDYHYRHEEILYGHLSGPGRPGRGNHPGTRWYGDNNQTSVFLVDRPSRSDLHPTIKPTALIEPMLANSSRRGEHVYDPFAGSGSTLIACERTGRRCLAVELDPAYCDVIRQRYDEVQRGR